MKYLPGGRVGFGLWMLLALPVVAGAQGVVLGSDSVQVRRSNGDVVVELDSGGDITAGGNGLNGDLFLNNTLGETILRFDPGSGDLRLGGGTSGIAGDLLVRDSDGLTTTIELGGRLGLLTLGAVGEDGDIYVNDTAGERTFQVDGNTGNVTNALEGNGLVKAWATVDSIGNVESCWKCSAAEKVSEGIIRVRFEELGDIRGRPRALTIYDPTAPIDVSEPLFTTRDSTTYDDAVVVEEWETKGIGDATRDSATTFVLVIF